MRPDSPVHAAVPDAIIFAVAIALARHAPDYRADPDIVAVDIDDVILAAMQDIGGLWPWPPEIHADLLRALGEFLPRAVVFDIMLSERDAMRPNSDAQLAEAVTAAPGRRMTLRIPAGSATERNDMHPVHPSVAFFAMRAARRPMRRCRPQRARPPANCAATGGLL